MNNDIRNILKENNIITKEYIKKGKTHIIRSTNKTIAIKEKVKDIDNLYDYLQSRSFDYYPRVISSNDKYLVTDYIEEVNMPSYEKAKDLVYLISLLHNKTTYYKDIDIDDYKIIYEDLDNRITYLNNYYKDLNNIIDEEVFMSPSNYYLVRNISKIYADLIFCKRELKSWYDIISTNSKVRVATIHNNLELDHFLKSKDSNYLISWDKSKSDLVVFDLYNLYIHNYEEIEFSELLSIYESKYPLKDEERKLLFIMISIPFKIEFSNDEFNNVEEVRKLINYISKTDKIISPYYTKYQETQE